MRSDPTHDRFRTTNWTDIRALATGDEDRRRRAIEALAARYWPPVYAYLRRVRGHDREQAAELTQAFFSEVVLARRLFEKADQRRGKLRTFLLTALNHFCTDQYRRSGPHLARVILSIEQLAEEDARLGDPAARPVDDAYERRWALGLLEESLHRCESHFREGGRSRHWELFAARILVPSVTGNAPEPLAQMAASAGFDSPQLAAAAVQTVKRRLEGFMRQVVAETLDNFADVDAELAEIRRCLTA